MVSVRDRIVLQIDNWLSAGLGIFTVPEELGHLPSSKLGKFSPAVLYLKLPFVIISCKQLGPTSCLLMINSPSISNRLISIPEPNITNNMEIAFRWVPSGESVPQSNALFLRIHFLDNSFMIPSSRNLKKKFWICLSR